MVQSTFGTSYDQSVTDSKGTTVTVEAGLNYGIASASVSTSIEHQVAETVMKGTSHQLSNSITDTIAKSVSVKAGTKALLTFTPTMRCYTADLNCNGLMSESDFCNPAVGPDGKLAQGEYTVVVVG